MDKEKEHIIADKTMLRVARITSIVFTPFSSAVPVFRCFVHPVFSVLLQLPLCQHLFHVDAVRL